VRPGADDAAPLESYVKMLVNSQLAAQGIPTVEPFQSSSEAGTYQGQRSDAPEPFQGQGSAAPQPFQVSETTAIPNASDYLKKVFRGVFS
jgi:hypothetical protein